MSSDVAGDDAFRRVQELTNELGIAGIPRLEMLSDPERALAVLEHARAATRIRNVAGFAIANWTSGFDPRPPSPAPPEPELEDAPPTLADLEQIWSDRYRAGGRIVLPFARASIERHGGFRPLLEQAFGRPQAELELELDEGGLGSS